MANRPYAHLDDATVQLKLTREIRWHDGLIDSTHMGDDRIREAQVIIDALRAEQQHRKETVS